jgi:cob(I)alamin adenosyltransferase
MGALRSGGLVYKDSDELCAIGELDELISYLGLIKSKLRSKGEKDILETMQRAISIIASEISISAEDRKRNGLIFKKAFVDDAQRLLFELESKVKIGKHFYIPGDNELSAFMDIARAVARRAERSVVALLKSEKIKNDDILRYLNCLSDILFMMARKSDGKGRGKTAKRKGK